MHMNDFPSRLNCARQLPIQRSFSQSNVPLLKILSCLFSKFNAMRIKPPGLCIATQFLYARMPAILLRVCRLNLKRKSIRRN